MKIKTFLSLLSLLSIVMFCSCSDNEADAEFAKLQAEAVQAQINSISLEYDSLPELLPLSVGDMESSTNFKNDGKKLTYNGEALIIDYQPLYGAGDMLLVNYMDRPVIVYKNNISVTVIAYDYSITGVRIKDNMILIKAWRTDHVMFIKQTFVAGQKDHTYLYGW